MKAVEGNAAGSRKPLAGTRGRTPEARAARDARIVEAIISLLREGGYGAVTTSAVAARADVSKETLYRRWQNKSELIVASLWHVLPTVDVPDLGSFEAEVRQLLQLRMEQLGSPGVRNIMAGIVGASAEDPLLAQTFLARTTRAQEAYHAIIQRAQDRGEVPRSMSAESLATMLAAPLVFRVVWERRAPDQELVDFVVHCVTSFAVQAGADSEPEL